MAAVKYLLWFLLLCSTALAQQLNGTTQFATILPDFQGRIIQYAFPVTPFEGWVERQHLKKYKWESVPNTVQVQTVDGVTQLNLIDTHDICGPKAGPVGACEYLGTLLARCKSQKNFFMQAVISMSAEPLSAPLPTLKVMYSAMSSHSSTSTPFRQ